MALGIDPEDRISPAAARPASKWPRHFSALVRVGVVLVVLGAAAASGWPYVKAHFLTPAAPSGPLPVIGPGDQPIKEAPKQPGGLQVPDQDKIILNGAAAQPKVEQILPPPPAPLPSPLPSPTPSVAQTPPAAPPSPPTAAAMPAPSPTAPAAPPAASVAAPRRTIEAPAPQAMAVAPPTPPSRPASAAPVQAAPPKPAPVATVSNESVPPQLAGHGWFVQLGAVRSTSAAQAEWTRLKHAQPDLLASLSANAVRVERGGGVLYRIEAGPLSGAGAASQLCRSLQQRHVACIVLRP